MKAVTIKVVSSKDDSYMPAAGGGGFYAEVYFGGELTKVKYTYELAQDMVGDGEPDVVEIAIAEAMVEDIRKDFYMTDDEQVAARKKLAYLGKHHKQAFAESEDFQESERLMRKMFATLDD